MRSGLLRRVRAAALAGPRTHDSQVGAHNRPIEEWGKLLQDVPSATAILDRFLHHAEIVAIKGKSYRLKDRALVRTKTDE